MEPGGPGRRWEAGHGVLGAERMDEKETLEEEQDPWAVDGEEDAGGEAGIQLGNPGAVPESTWEEKQA